MSELEEKNINIPMLFVPIEDLDTEESSDDRSTSLTRLGIYEQLGKCCTPYQLLIYNDISPYAEH